MNQPGFPSVPVQPGMADNCLVRPSPSANENMTCVEQDIAMTNISLDPDRSGRLYYQYAAELEGRAALRMTRPVCSERSIPRSWSSCPTGILSATIARSFSFDACICPSSRPCCLPWTPTGHIASKAVKEGPYHPQVEPGMGADWVTARKKASSVCRWP